MTACSDCGGQRVDNCVQHRPGCGSYRPADMLVQHPDIADIEANLDYWYGEDTA